MSIILSELPSKDNGYWEIVYFPYSLKEYRNQLLVKVEFIHKFYDKEKSKYIYGEIESIDVALPLLMEISIGDMFNCTTKELKIREKRAERKFFFDGRLEHHLKIFNYTRFKKFDSLLISETANGSFYYELEYSINRNDGRKRHIIIPAVVVAQAFFFKDTTFIELLYENKLRGVAKHYNKSSIRIENGKKIGVFKYDNSDDVNKNIKQSTGEAIGKFLFSNNDSLFHELEKVNNTQYLSSITAGSKIHFYYPIPIHKPLSLIIEGNYYTTSDEVIFLVHHISHVEGYKGHKLEIYTVDEIEIAPLIDKRSTDKRNEKEEIKINHTKYFRKPTRRNIRRNNKTPNSKLGEIDLKIKKAIFDFIKITKLKKEDQKYKYSSETSSITDQTENTSHKKSHNLESETTKVNGSEENKEIVSSYLREIMKTIKLNHSRSIKIMTLKDHFEGYEIYRICDSDMEKNLYFIEDFHNRIQVLHSEDLTKLQSEVFKKIFTRLEKNNYNWQKIKENNKGSDGIVFETSLNKYSEKKIDCIKNGYQKIIKRINEIFGLTMEI